MYLPTTAHRLNGNAANMRSESFFNCERTLD